MGYHLPHGNQSEPECIFCGEIGEIGKIPGFLRVYLQKSGYTRVIPALLHGFASWDHTHSRFTNQHSAYLASTLTGRETGRERDRQGEVEGQKRVAPQAQTGREKGRDKTLATAGAGREDGEGKTRFAVLASEHAWRWWCEMVVVRRSGSSGRSRGAASFERGR